MKKFPEDAIVSEISRGVVETINFFGHQAPLVLERYDSTNQVWLLREYVWSSDNFHLSSLDIANCLGFLYNKTGSKQIEVVIVPGYEGLINSAILIVH